MRNETLENYIETIDKLQRKMGKAGTKKIAQELGVKEPSVTEMLQKLKERGFVEHEPYQGAELTEKGKRLAGELREKHVTLAELLKMLGVDEKVAESDACKIKHVVGQETIDSLKKFLRFVEDSPKDPKWLKHYRQYIKTDEHPECESQE